MAIRSLRLADGVVIMRIARRAVLALLLTTGTSHVFTQTPAPPSPAGPTFEVVSIKRNVADRTDSRNLGSTVIQRPDGGFTMTNIPVSTLIGRAYPPAIPIEMIGLPEWVRTERYDVSATSTLSRATADDRTAMLRAMLANRFKLAVHVEKREEPVYDLVLARTDGRLGPGITPTEIDCDSQIAAQRAAAEAALSAGTPPPPPQRPDFNAPPPRCTLRMVGGVLLNVPADQMEGDTTMANLATTLRMFTGRDVVDKTGLSGFYHVKMDVDMNEARRGPGIVPPPGAAPSIFTVVQEQLGMKLQSSRAELDRLVIDRLERPTED